MGPETGTRKEHAKRLFASLPGRYDVVAAALSFGQDPRWRARMVAVVGAQPGQRVLDVATGTGLVAEELVRRWGCDVTGLDQSPEMLSAARTRAARNPGLGAHLRLVEGQAEQLPFDDAQFDHLTFTYLLRYVEDPGMTMRELARVVKPGGRIASLEFAVPTAWPWRWLWRLYVQLGLPLLAAAVSREWAQTGRFLAGSIPRFYAQFPLPRIVGLWQAAGIEGVHVERMSLGGGVVMWGTRGRPAADRPVAGNASSDDARGHERSSTVRQQQGTTATAG